MLETAPTRKNKAMRPTEIDILHNGLWNLWNSKCMPQALSKKTPPWPLVRMLTTRTDQPPTVGEI
jgi:hypothetical protein